MLNTNLKEIKEIKEIKRTEKVQEATDTKEKNNSLFNPSMKESFLEDQINNGIITKETSIGYARILGITAKLERKFKKDLNQLSFKELEDVLFSFKSKTINTVQSYARIISSYLNWSVKNGHATESHLEHLKPKDFEKYILNEEEYITEEELNDYEDQLKNAQDAVILRLLFIGVGGKQMSEIRNLKKEDVDFENNLLKLTESQKEDKQTGMPIEFSIRYLEVDDYTLGLIKEAMKELTYEKRNGEMDFHDNIRPYTELVDNDYVVRASATKDSRNNQPVDKFVIYRRIQTIAEYFRFDELKAKFIQRSGMIYRASKLINNDEFTLNNLKTVAKDFNVNSYHNLKGFLTYDNIRKVYGEGGEK